MVLRVPVCDDAEAIAKGVAAKRDGQTPAAFEFLLALRAGSQRLGQNTVEVVSMKIDVN